MDIEASITAKLQPIQDQLEPSPDKVIGIDIYGNGNYAFVNAPTGWNRDRVVNLQWRFEGREGVKITDIRVEHVADDSRGIWLYRVMP